jgi:hypothetical protein
MLGPLKYPKVALNPGRQNCPINQGMGSCRRAQILSKFYGTLNRERGMIRLQGEAPWRKTT